MMSEEGCHPPSPSPCTAGVRGGLSVLAISPELVSASVRGWCELQQMVLHAECHERARIEKDEEACVAAIHDAGVPWRSSADDVYAPRAAVESPRAPPTLYETNGSDLAEVSAAHADGSAVAAETNHAKTLTDYQRFCFTPSTAAIFCASMERKQHCHGLLQRRRSAPALPKHESKSPPRQQRGAPSRHPAATRDATASAARRTSRAAPRQRDAWEWSASPARGGSAPAAVPTLARTYGSAQQRAVAMGLLFDQLSHESKAVVARQAESLGLLLHAAGEAVVRDVEAAPGEEGPSNASLSALQATAPLQLTEATVLDGAHQSLPSQAADEQAAGQGRGEDSPVPRLT